MDKELLYNKAKSLGIDLNKHQSFIETELIIDDTTYTISSDGEVRRRYSSYVSIPATVISRISAILPIIHLGVNYESLKTEIERLEENNAEKLNELTEQTVN